MIMNFFLRNPSATRPTRIFLRLGSGKGTVKITTGESILPKDWDRKKQRAKRNLQLNRYLDELRNKVVTSYFENGRDMTLIKLSISGTKMSMLAVAEDYINRGGISENTRKTVKSSIEIMKTFINDRRMQDKFTIFTEQFFEDFSSFMIGKDFVDGTRNKYLKYVKAFVSWSRKKNHHQVKDVEVKYNNYDVETVALNYDELMKIYNMSLSGEMELVRDAFCLMCFTGMRVSDLTQLSSYHVKGDHIVKILQKTKKVVVIPLNKYSKAILAKYNGNAPSVHANTINKVIKDLAEIAEIKQPVSKTKYIDGQPIVEVFPKNKLITNHTGRRTFTTVSRRLGMDKSMIEKINGWSDPKMISKYDKLEYQDIIDAMNKAWG